jgi:hypothetical protein
VRYFGREVFGAERGAEDDGLLDKRTPPGWGSAGLYCQSRQRGAAQDF